jgi:hypothetical protein
MRDAYAHHRMAFTSTADERAVLPMEWWIKRIDGPGCASRAIGAFDRDTMLGCVALKCFCFGNR